MSENSISAEETKSLVLVGVGGQGILLASEIIARTIMASGYDVKMNEIHGMAQRGGSVVAQIRFGRDVEKIEVMRFVDYLADDGLAVVSDQEIIPVSASGGKIPYPALGEEDIRKVCPNLIYVHAIKLAEELGNARAANTILLGVMSNVLHFPEENWKESIRSCVKPKFVDVNIKAFEIGRAMK